MINWQNDPDGYAVTTLTTTGAVLALAESDTSGPVQWFSYWIAEGGHADSAVLAMDGHTVRILQGENAGQGLLMVWAIENGIVSNELVLMLLGEGYGSASYGSASTGNTGTGNTGTANAIALRSRATLKLVAKGALSGINSNNDWYGQVPATTLPGAVPFILLPTGGPERWIKATAQDAGGNTVFRNNVAVQFPTAVSAWPTIVAFGLKDQAGQLCFAANLTSTKTIAAGDAPVFLAGELEIAIG